MTRATGSTSKSTGGSARPEIAVVVCDQFDGFPLEVTAAGVEHPPITNASLNELFAAAWTGHQTVDFQPVLSRSLAFVFAFSGDRLAGYVNLAWDGGIHAFLLDTTVHRDFQRRGIGRELVLQAAEAARRRGIQWLHVDYEPSLESFYQSCGFKPTLAGLMRLSD